MQLNHVMFDKLNNDFVLYSKHHCQGQGFENHYCPQRGGVYYLNLVSSIAYDAFEVFFGRVFWYFRLFCWLD